MSSPARRPKRIAFVTGHVFGREALGGILDAPAFAAGEIELCFSAGLDPALADETVGYATTEDLVEGLCPHAVTLDRHLEGLAGPIGDARPDILLVVGWSGLVSDSVLALPRGIRAQVAGTRRIVRGIGMHSTKLPVGRGRAPIPWTIIKGLTSTALTTFVLVTEPDAGPVLAQHDLTVDPQETAASLFARFRALHRKAGGALAAMLAAGDLTGTAQDEKHATVWPRRWPADGLLEPTMSRQEVDAAVRALVIPYPGARLVAGGVEYRVEATSYFGAIVNADESHRVVVFQCSDGDLDLLLCAL